MPEPPRQTAPPRRRVWPQVMAATVVTALILGAIVTGLLAAGASPLDEPWTLARAVRQWALWSAVASPVAFVFGAVAFVIGRSVWQGRKQA